MASQILSLPGITLGAAIESLILTKNFPQYLPERNAFVYAFIRLFAINCGLFVGYWGLIYPFFISPLRHFPGPKAWTYSRYLPRRAPGCYFLEWSNQIPNDGVLLLPSALHSNRLLLTKPKALAEVLVAHPYDYTKPKKIRDFLRHVLGDGLIIVEGDLHKFQRKHLMPSFNIRHLRDLYPMMWCKALTLTEAIKAEIKEHPAAGQDIEKADAVGMTEINGWASKITLDIIGIAGLGTELHALKNSDNELVKDYEELLEPRPDKLAFFLMMSFVSVKLTKALPWKLNQIFEATTSSLRTISRQLVHDKREAMKTGSEEHFDILSLLIKSNDFSDDELIDQLLTFLAAGHETTSSAFTWVCFLLATHLDIQQTLRNEIREAFPGNPESDPTVDLAGTLEKLPWLNAVCHETLRLFPTVPITMRVAIRETRILDQPIPSGTEIFICPWAVNRSPELWGPDAEEFKPERWIDVDETGEKRPNNSGGADSNYSLMSFLHGPRSCIGQNFAKAELRCLVAAFVNVFEWSLDMPVEEVIPAGVITIKPKSGLHLKLKKIGTW